MANLFYYMIMKRKFKQ